MQYIIWRSIDGSYLTKDQKWTLDIFEAWRIDCLSDLADNVLHSYGCHYDSYESALKQFHIGNLKNNKCK